MCMVYLAGAIDMIQDKEERDVAKTWKVKANKELNEYRISTIDPAGTFSMGSQITRYLNEDKFKEFMRDAKKLYDINSYNMFASDVVLMRLGDEPTIGTPMELMIDNYTDNYITVDNIFEDIYEFIEKLKEEIKL